MVLKYKEWVVQFRITIKETPLLKYLKFMPIFLREYHQFKKQAKHGHIDFLWGKFHPCFEDRLQESGTASGHYFHQDLLVAGKFLKTIPSSMLILAHEWMVLLLMSPHSDKLNLLI